MISCEEENPKSRDNQCRVRTFLKSFNLSKEIINGSKLYV